MSSRIIMSAEEMQLSLNRIVLQILEKHRDIEKTAIVGIYTCGVYLAKRMVAIINEMQGCSVSYGSLDITLYRDDWSLISQNPVVKTTNIDFDVSGKHVILVDDVLFTGRTVRAAMDALNDYGRPWSIELATLVDRGGRQLPIQPDYCGAEVTVRSQERIQVVMSEQGVSDSVYIENC